MKENREEALKILSNDEIDSEFSYQKEYRKQLSSIADKEMKFNEDIEKHFQRRMSWENNDKEEPIDKGEIEEVVKRRSLIEEERKAVEDKFKKDQYDNMEREI